MGMKRIESREDGSYRETPLFEASEQPDNDLPDRLLDSYGLAIQCTGDDFLPHAIDEYMDRAIEESHLGSERQLAKALNVSSPTVTAWRKRRALPSDQSMIALAELAHKDPDVALIVLNCLRTQSENARKSYLAILSLIDGLKHAKEYDYTAKLIKKTATVFLIAASLTLAALITPAAAATEHPANRGTSALSKLYIMRFKDGS